VPSARNLKFQI